MLQYTPTMYYMAMYGLLPTPTAHITARLCHTVAVCAVAMQEADLQEGHTACKETGGDGTSHEGAEVRLQRPKHSFLSAYVVPINCAALIRGGSQHCEALHQR